MSEIYRIAEECKDYMISNVSIRKNRVISGNMIFTDYDIIGDLMPWKELLLQLHKAIRVKYASIASELKESIEYFDDAPIRYFSSIETILNCILSIEDIKIGKRIFISHSSKDKRYVENFVNHVLCLGVGITRDDIFCTSIEDLAIKNGEDIRRHIQDSIRSAEYSFLFISDNYKASEICLNEMGAVWAFDSNVRLYLLPNSSFDDIGWLCDTRKANKLSDSVALDRLYQELIDFFSLPNNFVRWSQQRETFIQHLL